MPSHNDTSIFSVSEFIEYINIAVGQRRVSVEGEVSGYNVNQGKWVFFDLKDEDGKIGCFAAAWNLGTALEDGMQIVVHGVPRIHPKSGKFSITVQSVELRGEGALRRAYELTKKKLEQEGLFDPSRKRDLPRFPETIGVIASRDSAAYSDFSRIVNGRWSGLTILLYHVQVQGARAIDDIVRAFEWFNTQGAHYGVESIALIRGGGSLEDLQAFNSEAVARVVFGSKIPVVCGVGHERDETLADYAADVRAATPTHAASLIVPDREEALSAVSENTIFLSRSRSHLMEWYASRTHTAALTLHTALRERIGGIADLLHLFTRSGEDVRARVGLLRNRCDHARALLAERFAARVELHTQSLAFIKRTLAQMNPLTVLSRGYTIVRKKGALVTRTKGLHAGDELSVTFADGAILTEVTKL
jgi:exodeoxyribonuclease VII large subunit